MYFLRKWTGKIFKKINFFTFHSKNLIDKIKEQERESVLAKGREYALKPTSYKSSLSLKLPGNISKRSK
jgi:hypothetical protein